jgi:hypothetical protein
MSFAQGAMGASEKQKMKFCDLKCIHAVSPRSEMDGGRSCMTFTAIYCELHERHVMKAQQCPDKAETDDKRGAQ